MFKMFAFGEKSTNGYGTSKAVIKRGYFDVPGAKIAETPVLLSLKTRCTYESMSHFASLPIDSRLVAQFSENMVREV